MSESLGGLPDLSGVAKRANDKLQRLENAAAKAEGREPVNLREQARERRRAMRAGA